MGYLPLNFAERITIDREAVATELVRIRARLDEMKPDVDGTSETDVDDERRNLEDRIRALEDRLSAEGSNEPVGQDLPAELDDRHFSRRHDPVRLRLFPGSVSSSHPPPANLFLMGDRLHRVGFYSVFGFNLMLWGMACGIKVYPASHLVGPA